MSFKLKTDWASEPFWRQAALPLAIMALTLGATLWLLLPRLSRLNQALRQNRRLIEQRRVFLQKAQLIASLDEKELRENARLATFALPKEKEISLILYALGGPARNNNFYTEKLEFNLGEMTGQKAQEKTQTAKKSKPPKKVLIERIPVRATFLGPRKNLISFLRQMEETLPLVEVRRLKGRFGAERATVELSLSLFLSPQDAVYNPEKVTLVDLTLSEEEEKLLNQLAQFKRSPWTADLGRPGSSSFSVGRENPFVLNE